MDDGEEYSTDLLLASLLDDSIDDDSTSQQTPNHSSSALVEGPVTQPSIVRTADKQAPDNKTAPAFDSLEDLLNATLSPSEGSTSDVGRSSTSSLDAVSTGESSRKHSASLPPKFRNTFKPVEASDTAGLDYSASTSPSFVVAASQPLPVSTSTNKTSDNGSWYLKNNASTSNSSWNDPLYPPSKRPRSEDYTTSKEPLPISSNSYSTYSGVPSLLGRSGIVTTTNTTVPIMAPQVAVPTTSLNGILSSSTSNTTAAPTNAAALKRLQETNLINDLQAASTKPISSASILHAIQVVQLNYGMLLQKLSQSIDDTTAQEVKTKLMVLTHHYKQLSQQYQAKLSAEKLSSTATTTTVNTLTKMNATPSSVVTNTSFTVSSHMSQPSVSNVTTTTTCLPSNVIDLTHDKSVKTTASAGKDSNVLSAAATTGANYLQSIPSLAAYLLQNTEAQKQLTPVELHQLNQIRINLLQEFQRRQVQNFLTSLPADIRPKNVNELKDMMKEKNFSIQVSLSHPISINVLIFCCIDPSISGHSSCEVNHTSVQTRYQD